MATDLRSDLVDVTYQQLHATLVGASTSRASPDSIESLLKPRVKVLADLTNPFGKPNTASKAQVQTGEVELADGVKLKVDDVNRDVVLGLADKFQIDEVHALVLLRSFLYNEGISGTPTTKEELIKEVTDHVTPFYHTERLSVLRVLLPLFRAMDDPGDALHTVAEVYLDKIFPERANLADLLLTEYTRKRKEKLPSGFAANPREASRWAKQNVKEQLALLEVIFWAVWNYVPCDGPFAERLLTVAYESDLGSDQEHATFLLDAEGGQLMEDAAVLWTVITIEVFDLEKLSENLRVEMPDQPPPKATLTAYPESLTRIHQLISSNGHSKFSCTYLAWSYVVSRLEASAKEQKEVPGGYRKFFEALRPPELARSREPVSTLMATRCMDPNVGLLQRMHAMLTNSPLFVTALAWKTGSTLTDPNAIAYRSVLKGMLMAMVELVEVDFIPDYEGLVEVWICLFGRSEPNAVSMLCSQFWTSDWHHNNLRRDIFRVAASRFPLQFRPLIRLLRAMTGSGFLDTDELSIHDFHLQEGLTLDPARTLCDDYVFYYFENLQTYAQVIPGSLRTGPHPLYDKTQVRSAKGLSGIEYVNTRPVKLPGGSTVPPKCSGTLLSEDAGPEGNVVVFWDHKYSGWNVALEFLVDYVSSRPLRSGTAGAYGNTLAFKPRGALVANQVVALRFADVGLEMQPEEVVDAVTDVLDLIRSTIQDNAQKAEQIMESMEAGSALIGQKAGDTTSPDLTQLTTIILEDALARSAQNKRGISPYSRLIASAISVLSALLALPHFSHRVWLYLRSTTSVFGSEQKAGYASSVLAAERLTGHYIMTLALLHLTHELFKEASSSLLPVLASEKTHLQAVKEEVLMRATRFVHGEIWAEHMGWKYSQLGDRFEIGRRITAYYADVLTQSTPFDADAPFASLRQATLDVMLGQATTSSVTPLISAITTAGPAFRQLEASRRVGEARRLIFLLESALRLTRILLTCKQQSNSPGISLLEHSLLATVSRSSNGGGSQTESVEVLVGYVKGRGMTEVVPLEAMRVLYALCSSLASNATVPSSILGRLSDPGAFVTSLVRIVQHPYDELPLRIAAWNFMALAINSEPALATLFVTGHLDNLGVKKDVKGKGKEKEKDESLRPSSALSAACEMLKNYDSLWESNPQLLACVLKVLDAVWCHGLEHKTDLEDVRKDESFWSNVAAIIKKDIGPVPEPMDEGHSDHEALVGPLAEHAYRIAAKAQAVQLIAEDMRLHAKEKPAGKPLSYVSIEKALGDKDQLFELVTEAAVNSYQPAVYDALAADLQSHLPVLSMETLRVQDLEDEREYGNHFAFSTTLLQTRLTHYKNLDNEWATRAHGLEARIVRLNLDLSISHAQSSLAVAWRELLEQSRSHLRAEKASRARLFEVAAAISEDIAREVREGDLSSSIHGQRLRLALALVEAGWFAEEGQSSETPHFMALVKNLQSILHNEAQPPIQCFLGPISQPFHRPLLQIIYFCARNARILARSPKALSAENRIDLLAMLDNAIAFTINGLCIVFDKARNSLDIPLDEDMELLVAVFEQCIDPTIRPTANFWLTRCQETDIIRSSLELFSHIDLVGMSDLAILRHRRQPLYTPHLLRFHLILARSPPAAARLASEGLLSTYSNNAVALAANSGRIDVTIPELPGKRSPAHVALCSMLSVVSATVIAIGPNNHFVNTEVGGFIQLYASQVTRTLEWSIDEPLTFAFLEEMERVMEMFNALASVSQPPAGVDLSINQQQSADGGPAARLLKEFAWRTLPLIQQLNYALTHPNHLARSLEPIDADERSQLEKEASTPMQASSELVDPSKRPVLAGVVNRLFGVASNILSSLIVLSGAETVLLMQPPDWPAYDTLIEVDTKVSVNHPASQGTLVDLANCVLDVLRFLVDQPGPPSSIKSTKSSKSVTVQDNVQAARQLLEAIAFYAVTQLAQARVRESREVQSDVSMDADQVSDAGVTQNTNGRAKRPSMASRDRVDRVNDAATDLAVLLRKANPVIAKSDGKLGAGKEKSVDVSGVLLAFLQERVMVGKS